MLMIYCVSSDRNTINHQRPFSDVLTTAFDDILCSIVLNRLDQRL
jgi:hypothetical protein